jgi:hypothetical protein
MPAEDSMAATPSMHTIVGAERGTRRRCKAPHLSSQRRSETASLTAAILLGTTQYVGKPQEADVVACSTLPGARSPGPEIRS